jgi:predicted dinucleotide-binding enzyme
VNAFTSIWSTVIRNPGNSGKTSAFVCSDDEDAKAVIMQLAEELGFEPVNNGELNAAIYAEVLGALVQIYGMAERPSVRASGFQADSTAVQMVGAIWP